MMKVETNTGVNLTIVRGKTSFVSEETGVKFVCFVFARSLVSACNIDHDHEFRYFACSGYLLRSLQLTIHLHSNQATSRFEIFH